METRPQGAAKAKETGTMRGPPQPNSFRVAIIGGGIGGLITAISLAHHCPEINIDVYEQAPAYAEIGAGVGIAVNAAKVLHRLGVGKAANAISGERNHIHRTHRRWDNGKEIVTVRADFDEGDIRQLSVHRAEFLDILLDAIKERGIATLHTNKKCIGLRVSRRRTHKFNALNSNSKAGNR